MKPALASPVWREADRLIRRERRPLLLALLLTATNRAAALALPTGSRYVVDEVIGGQRGDELWLVAILVGAAIAIEAGAGLGAIRLAGAAGQRASAGVRQELQARIVGLPLRRLEASPAGALAARVMTDSEQVRFLVGSGLVQLLASVLTATLALGLLFSINAPLTLAVLTVVGLAGFGLRCSFRRIRTVLEVVLRRQSELAGRLSQVLGGIRVVKAYAAERHETYRFVLDSHHLVRESVRALRDLSVLGASVPLASGTLGALVLVVGGRAVAAGGMSLGDLVMYAWLLGFLLGPVTHVAASAGELGKAMAALGRIADLRALPTEAEEDGSCNRLHRIVGAVDFEDVSYGYATDHLALCGVRFHVPPGSMFAVVGANGSGKTTLCRLLLAYDRPTAGRILIDGQDMTTLDRQGYRSRLGVVGQDDVLFHGTIGDNIRYARPRASLAALRAAARLAHCDEFVAGLPEGYSTLVGERGLGLSAGERQRIAIARAFLADPRILVLDEPTSSLDADSERLVQHALRVLAHGRTTFVVTHHLTCARGADQILMLDRGSVVELGTHHELIASRGRYFRLWEAQCHGDSGALGAPGSGQPEAFPASVPARVGGHTGGNGRAY